MPANTLSPMGRPKKPEPSEPVRIPRSFARKLRRLALHAEKDPGDYLVAEFGSALDRKHAKMVEELAKGDDSQAGQK
jgi:hypothetical protein